MEGGQETVLGMRFLSRTNSSWRGKEIDSFLQINTSCCGGGRRKEEILISTRSQAVPTCALVWEHKQRRGPRGSLDTSPAAASSLQLSPARALAASRWAGTRTVAPRALHDQSHPPQTSPGGQLSDPRALENKEQQETNIILSVKKQQSTVYPHLPCFFFPPSFFFFSSPFFR